MNKLFIPLKMLKKWLLLFSPFYRQTTGDPEKLRNLPKIIQLVTSRLGFEPKLNLHSPSSKNYAFFPIWTYLKIIVGIPVGSMIKNLLAKVQETVQYSIWEDPMCRRTTQPVQHSCWVCALEPRSRNCWSLWAREPLLCNEGSHHNEKPAHRN